MFAGVYCVELYGKRSVGLWSKAIKVSGRVRL